MSESVSAFCRSSVYTVITVSGVFSVFTVSTRFTIFTFWDQNCCTIFNILWQIWTFSSQIYAFFVVTDAYALFDIPSEKTQHNFINMRGNGQQTFINFIKKNWRFFSGWLPLGGRTLWFTQQCVIKWQIKQNFAKKNNQITDKSNNVSPGNSKFWTWFRIFWTWFRIFFLIDNDIVIDWY